MRRITVHIVVSDAARAAEWYSNVLGAEERGRITLPDGRLIHLELWFGESVVMVADEFPEHGAVAPTTGSAPMAFYLHVEEVDPVWQHALDTGAAVHRPLGDTAFGERDGQIIDPFGYRWGLTQHLRDVSLEEMGRAAAEVFGS